MLSSVPDRSMPPMDHTQPVGSIAVAAVHGAALLLAIVVSVVVGRPAAWIGFGLWIGPLAASRFAPTSRWRDALAFALVAGGIIGGGWALTFLPDLYRPLFVVFPVGVLLTLLGIVNFVLVSVSRTRRAWRGQPLDYPWIPTRLASILSLDDSGDGHGNR